MSLSKMYIYEILKDNITIFYWSKNSDKIESNTPFTLNNISSSILKPTPSFTGLRWIIHTDAFPFIPQINGKLFPCATSIVLVVWIVKLS